MDHKLLGNQALRSCRKLPPRIEAVAECFIDVMDVHAIGSIEVRDRARHT
jgi:hypothetical protein